MHNFGINYFRVYSGIQNSESFKWQLWLETLKFRPQAQNQLWPFFFGITRWPLITEVLTINVSRLLNTSCWRWRCGKWLTTSIRSLPNSWWDFWGAEVGHGWGGGNSPPPIVEERLSPSCNWRRRRRRWRRRCQSKQLSERDFEEILWKKKSILSCFVVCSLSITSPAPRKMIHEELGGKEFDSLPAYPWMASLSFGANRVSCLSSYDSPQKQHFDNFNELL